MLNLYLMLAICKHYSTNFVIHCFTYNTFYIIYKTYLGDIMFIYMFIIWKLYEKEKIAAKNYN